MKTVLVTGGAGYLGVVLCDALLRRGYAVRVFDQLYFGEEPLAELRTNPHFELVRGKLQDLAQFPNLFDDACAVIHLGGLANDPSCDLDPEMTEVVNYRGSVELAERARDAGAERFLFASSCSVYGDSLYDVVDEDAPLRPVSLYAETKARTEETLARMSSESFAVVSLRQATLFGYSARMRFDLAINLMTLHAVTKKRILIMGGGAQWRPFVHVRDSAEAFIACLEARVSVVEGQVFNVGRNRENFQVAELAKLVQEELPETELEFVPEDVDKRSYRVNSDRIERVFGWSRSITVREGILEVASALREGKLPDTGSTRYYNVQRLRELLDIPVEHGGEPIRASFLPFSLPLLGEEEEKEVVDTLRSGWITTGPKAKRFEQMLAEYVGTRHVVALNSCTGALHLSLVALGVGPGDEVITSPVTWPSTANVIVHTGATPVFADVDPRTLNIDPRNIEEKITERTKAIIPVHMAGLPCDMDAISAIALKHDLHVVEDAAHALGAQYKGQKIGTISDLTCYSFYPIKNITTIEGGAVATDNDQWAENVRINSLHGVSKDAWKRYSASGVEHWEVLSPGFKYNMTDVQAAVGIHQIPKLDGFIRRRAEISRMYDLAFAETPEIETPQSCEDVLHARHLYIILIDLKSLCIDRDEFMIALRQENIGTGIHFRSLHIQPYYRQRYAYQPDDLPNAACLSDRILSLPLYPAMTDRDARTVIDAVRKTIKYYRSGKKALIHTHEARSLL